MSDLGRVLAARGLRAFVYGFGSVLLGAALAEGELSGTEVGMVFAALLAGSALASLLLVSRADRLGRRRVYAVLLWGMAASGTTFALTDSLPLLIVAALTGTVSVEVVESGPFTSLEQAIVPRIAARRTSRAFGTYNALAALVGSTGALLAALPELLSRTVAGAPAPQRWLLVYPLAAGASMLLVRRLSSTVEARRPLPEGPRLRRSRGPVLRMAGLFAVDSFAGGFIVQSFVVFWFTRELGAPPELMAAVLATTGLIQTASFLLAPRLAARIGLLNTMVFTHLPSNLMLAAIPFAPNLGTALLLLLLRFPLSQMDVPARQAYLAMLAGPDELTAAASVTNAARTAVRPISPLAAGAVVGTSVAGLPFLLAGGLKAIYDVALYLSFRRLPVEQAEGARHPPRTSAEPTT